MLKIHTKTILLFLVCFLVIIFSIYFFYPFNTITTNDAYINGNIVLIAPEISGKVKETYVNNNEHVEKNRLLLEIDPENLKLDLNASEANLELTKQSVGSLFKDIDSAYQELIAKTSELKNAKINLDRLSYLMKYKLISNEALDNARNNYYVANASLKAANSNLEGLRLKVGAYGQQNPLLKQASANLAKVLLNLEHTKIFSPVDGMLMKFSVRPGSVVDMYQNLFAIIEDDNYWVDANFKETDIGKIKKGDKATIKIDMYKDKVFHGVVESISPGSGATLSLFPTENATGNWIKIVQRFTVRIAIKDVPNNLHLRVGSSAEVALHLN